MSEMFQTAQALSTAATKVADAKVEVTQRCAKLSGDMETLRAAWGGQGAAAFQGLMMAWQDKQRTILTALENLGIALEQTEKDNVSTDEAQSAAASNLHSRLD